MPDFIGLESKYGAHNYAPLEVVLTRGKGVWLWDIHGRKYLDMMSAYSAISHGHCHPKIVRALSNQAKRLAVTSRAFYTDTLGPLEQKLCALTGLDKALLMNSGAEAVETAVKAARRWGYQVKGIPANKAEIIVASNNFHGRTTTIISFSTETDYQKDFGPLTPGFKAIPFGDAKALEEAITPNTCAFLVEPIQGEAGIIVPPAGWLKQVRDICSKNNVLLILDEIQSGLGRTGKTFCYQHNNIQPDGVILGKALGGGLLPVSAFIARHEIMDLFNPGSHGSTFGGNPLAATVALTALQVLEHDKLVERSEKLGTYFMAELKKIKSPLIKEIRGRGLWVGLEIDPRFGKAKDICKALAKHGLLTKDTHEVTLRLAPPLVIKKSELDLAVKIIRDVLLAGT
jgi:ornithine--oxo-acid transaminase